MFISEVLQTAQDTGGIVLVKSATDTQIQALREDLENKGLTLPNEYSDFLKETNGLYWASLEFFGSAMTKKDGVVITDLTTQNDLYQKLNGNDSPLFLGRSDEENFLYDSKEKTYLIVDEFSKEVAKSFPLFEQMFEYLMMEQNELIQNCVGFAPEEEETDEPEDEEASGVVDLHFFK